MHGTTFAWTMFFITGKTIAVLDDRDGENMTKEGIFDIFEQGIIFSLKK